ncbi:WASH complex subunit 3 [Planococcus citri]|uniref:WASH complex subunit 3 n=1 Tax=Planococcus citri TaxID=170843 RepID=UPI0031F75C5C
MDIQKIPPIHQKRIVTFMNYFIVDTVSFLNKFINSTEDSLWKIEKRMRKLETSLKLLEMKLNCIPDLQEPKNDLKTSAPEESSSTLATSSTNQTETPEVIIDSTEQHAEAAENTKEEVPAELQKYYKMYQVGVPLNAVKNKMKLEGFDPDLLKLP